MDRQSPIDAVLARLPGVKSAGPAGGWKAKCPAHPDKTPSLSISIGDTGSVLLHCHAGCPVESIVGKMGLTMPDLCAGGNGSSHVSAPPPPPAKTYATANEAVAVLSKRAGPVSQFWVYHDAAGLPCGVICRWNLSDGKKDIRPVSRLGKGWILGGMPEPRPLYALPDLMKRRDERVYVVEGEKAADAVRSLGLLATTSPHGANSGDKSDWSALAGRDVCILPDLDAPGEKYADAVTAKLGKLAPPATVRRLGLPGMSEPGSDAFDWIAVRRLNGQSDATTMLELENLAEAVEPTVGADNLPPDIGADALAEQFPSLKPVIIEGLVRETETVNIVAAAKSHKTFLAIGLALSIATGRRWLGRDVAQGDVLYIDCELHRETFAARLRAVMSAMGVDHAPGLTIKPIRGCAADIKSLGNAVFRLIAKGRYKVIFLDALYRLFPPRFDENSNADMTGLYNQIDAYAKATGAAFVVIHHASKGSQSDKSVTDVGSGAGAQSRAADAHLVFRPHEEEGCIVLDGAVRSFPPVPPTCLRWFYPVWSLADGLDPTKLRKPGKRGGAAKEDTSKPFEPEPIPWNVDNFVGAFLTPTPISIPALEAKARAAGLPLRQVRGFLDLAIGEGKAWKWRGKGVGNPVSFATVGQPIEGPLAAGGELAT